MKILLGSQSPRRKELLKGLGIPFECRSIDVEETYPSHLQAEEIPLFLSQLKAQAYLPKLDKDTLLITADTIVWHNGKVFGKPHSIEEARRMLHALSGQTHQVITGVSLTQHDSQRSFHTCTEVRFATLEEDEINFYIDRFNPMDKAGAYGIQEWIGYIGVEHINGSYFNVMGLPIQRLYKELKAMQVIPPLL